MKKRELKRYKKSIVNVIILSSAIFLVYLSIPFFFDYKNNKSVIEKKVSNNFNLNINMKSEVKYSIFPSPRIKLYDVEILSFSNSKYKIGFAEKVTLNIPFTKLINFKKISFNFAKLFNAQINIQTSEFKNFKKYLKDDKRKHSVQLVDSKINFLDKEQLLLILDIKKIDFFNEDLAHKTRLKGKVFNNDIKGEYQYLDTGDKPVSIFALTFPKIGIKINSKINFDKKEKIYYGNTKILYPNNKLNFEYKYNKKALNILDSNLVNNSFKGKLLGEISFAPFLFFDLKMSINDFKFQKFLTTFFKKNNTFIAEFIPVNKKVNGILSIDIEEIKSSSKIINAASIILEFQNGDIITKEGILNLNKFGNIKIAGRILEQKNKKIFYFDTITNVTNPNFFYSRFLIPKRKRVIIKPVNLTGNVDLSTYKVSLEKLYYNEKLNDEIMLELNEMINNSISQNDKKNFFDQSNLRKIIQSLFK